MLLRLPLRLLCSLPPSRLPARRAAAQSSPSPPPAPPAVDATQLSAACAELSRLAPALVTSLQQSDAHTVCLQLRTPSSRHCLWLCWHPQSGRLALGPPPDGRRDADAFSLAHTLRAVLSGACLLSAKLLSPFERVALLDFAPRPGEPPQTRLVLEATGAHANLFLLEMPGGRVTCAGYQTGERHSRARRLATGDVYAAPTQQPGLPHSADWRQAALQCAQHAADGGKPAMGVAAALGRVLSGASPGLARALCAAAALEPSLPPAQLSEPHWAALSASVSAWGAAMEGSDAATALLPGLFGIPLPPGEGGGAGQAETPVGAALHALHFRWAARDSFERTKAQLLSRCRAALKRVSGKARGFEAAVARGSEAAPQQALAELLVGQLHKAAPGAPSVALTDWATGEEVSCALDPAKSALHSAEKLFAQARKARRGSQLCLPMLAEARAEEEYLLSCEQALEALSWAEGGDCAAVLSEVEQEMVAAGLAQPNAAAQAAQGAQQRKGGAAKAKPKAADAAVAGVRRFSTPEGSDVFVGRNNRGNESVSHGLCRSAPPGSLWFHARGVPGAHVLLRVSPGRVASDAERQFCASLAAFFSKERGAAKALVSCCQPQHVRRAPGGRLGSVVLDKEEAVLTGRPPEVAQAAEAAEAKGAVAAL
jgi:predicted ribosome quality control (RQC) complex YloA/Tae2 family protein